MGNQKSFTVKSTKGLLRQLITKCLVSVPYLPSSTSKEPELIEFNALWDTGASGTVITQRVVDALGLKPVGKVNVYHANGADLVDRHLVNIYLPNLVAFPAVSVNTGVLNGFDILIGMDIIATGDFAITNFEGKTCFSFRHPSSEVIDFVGPQSSISEIKPTETYHADRNAKCPCNSGKKYKHCHGKNY